MLLLQHRRSFVAVAGLLCLFGCGARYRIGVANYGYRIVSRGGESLLLPPPVPAKLPGSSAIRFRLRIGGAVGHGEVRACSFEEEPFSFAPDARRAGVFVLTLPSAEVWNQMLDQWSMSGGEAELPSVLARFVAGLDGLEAKGCVPAGDGLSVKELVAESLPMRVGQGLFGRYGYRMGKSGIDLKPGLRLRIERAYYANDSGKRSVGNYLGLSKVEYGIREDGQRRRWLSMEATSYAPDTFRPKQEGADPEFSRLRRLGRMRLYRLVFLTNFVRQGRQRSAIILGSNDEEVLDAATRRAQTEPDLRCSDLAAVRSVACVEFDGDVTLTPEVAVKVNGVTSYAEWETALESLLTQKGVGEPRSVLGSLRVAREFNGRLSAIQFDSASDEVLKLVLVGGDSVSWNNR